jgi:RNA polymerase-binding transcription factor DksA
MTTKKKATKKAAKKVAKKPPAKKSSAKKAPAKKAAAKKAAAKKPSAKKAAAKKAPAKKAPAKKAAAKKAPAKKAPAKKTAAKKAPAKKAPAKKSPSTSTVKATAKKAVAKKVSGKAASSSASSGASRSQQSSAKPSKAAKKASPPTTVSKSKSVTIPKEFAYLHDKKWLAGQREQLLKERASYTSSADRLAAEAAALMADREPGDVQFDEESGEGDTIAVERDRDLALSAAARQSVSEIDAALERLDNGTYGVCVAGDDIIPRERLEAIPEASVCVTHKTSMF